MAITDRRSDRGWLTEGVLVGIIVVSLIAANLPVSRDVADGGAVGGLTADVVSTDTDTSNAASNLAWATPSELEPSVLDDPGAPLSDVAAQGAEGTDDSFLAEPSASVDSSDGARVSAGAPVAEAGTAQNPQDLSGDADDVPPTTIPELQLSGVNVDVSGGASQPGVDGEAEAELAPSRPAEPTGAADTPTQNFGGGAASVADTRENVAGAAETVAELETPEVRLDPSDGAEDFAALVAPEATGPQSPAQIPTTEAEIASPSISVPSVAAPTLESSPNAPRFDLVRVDADGTAVLAGQAAPGALVSIVLGGETVTTTRAGDDGKFAALFLVAPSVAPQQVGLIADSGGDDGGSVPGSETLIIAPAPGPLESPTVPKDASGVEAAPDDSNTVASRIPAAQPRLLLADQDGMRVVQPATGRPAVQTSVSIDAIAYDVEGTVVLSGRGSGTVRIYLDNRPVETVPVAADGQWRTPLPVVDTGVYQLRVDELDASGAVTSRTVTPFRREDAARIVALAEEQETVATGPRLITVQPGSTLWGIAREEYGRGVLFVRVFEANKGEISDPHWIYPGQIFTMPDGGE